MPLEPDPEIGTLWNGIDQIVALAQAEHPEAGAPYRLPPMARPGRLLAAASASLAGLSGVTLLTCLIVMSLAGTSDDVLVAWAGAAVVAAAAPAFMVNVIWLYRAWRIIPNAYVPLSAPAVVVPLLIPGVNLLWIVPAILMLTRAVGTTASARGQARPKFSEVVAALFGGVSLLAIPLWGLGWIPYVFWLLRTNRRLRALYG